MIVDTQYQPNTKKLIVSYVDKKGKIKLKYYDWETPLKYVACESFDKDKHPKYRSWDNKSIKQVEVNYPDRYSIYEFLDNLSKEEKEEIYEFNVPDIYFVDIETEIVDGFPDAESAATRVLSISVVYDDKIILMGLKELSKEAQGRIINNTNEYFKKYNIEYKLKFIKYEDEFDMLYTFFDKMVPKMPLITGWNFLAYDWMYLMNRSRKLTKNFNGVDKSIPVHKSSQTGRVSKIWKTEYEVPSHRMIFDYMQLYEICDSSVKVKESSSLDFVSNKVVQLEKIKYSGSLQTLYEEDYETYMYYNAVDSILVQKIHDERNYISIIFAISSLAQIRISDVVSQLNNALASLAITEGVLRNRFRDMEDIILFRDETNRSSGKGILGGWVMDPVIGMNRWVVIYDFASLYPTTMLQFFIAPETFIGIQDKIDSGIARNGLNEVRIDTEKHVVCVNGAVFEKRLSPTLQMIEDVYKDRKVNKNIMMSKKEELKEIELQIKRLELEV